jgi:hypothetical protein
LQTGLHGLAMGWIEEREALRADWVRRIPRWYSPWVHLSFTVLLGPAVIVVALTRIQELRPLELLTVPAVFLISNIAEWHIHKGILHRPLPGIAVLYKEHTLQHHRLYLTDDMRIRSWKELRLVLLPPVGIVLLIAVIVPIGLGLEHLGHRNVGMLWVASATAYVVSYEWLHLSYHLPEGHPIGQVALIRRLSRHHALHHSPERMGSLNMNVTVPLWDWVRGTIAKD